MLEAAEVDLQGELQWLEWEPGMLSHRSLA